MTKDNEEQLLKDVRNDMLVLKARIVGDPFAKPPEPGLVDIVDQHRAEIYGHEAIQHVGLKRELAALKLELAALKSSYKSDRNWVLASASALSFGIGLAWYFAQLFFGK